MNLASHLLRPLILPRHLGVGRTLSSSVPSLLLPEGLWLCGSCGGGGAALGSHRTIARERERERREEGSSILLKHTWRTVQSPAGHWNRVHRPVDSPLPGPCRQKRQGDSYDDTISPSCPQPAFAEGLTRWPCSADGCLRNSTTVCTPRLLPERPVLHSAPTLASLTPPSATLGWGSRCWKRAGGEGPELFTLSPFSRRAAPGPSPCTPGRGPGPRATAHSSQVHSPPVLGAGLQCLFLPLERVRLRACLHLNDSEGMQALLIPLRLQYVANDAFTKPLRDTSLDQLGPLGQQLEAPSWGQLHPPGTNSGCSKS